MTYASKTEVPVEKTEQDIKTMLKKFGADQIVTQWSEDKSIIGFRVQNLVIKITLYLPTADDPEVTFGPSGRRKSAEEARGALNQLHRSYWRSMLLIIKAKIEAIEKNVSTVEREFYPDVVLPGGLTMAEYIGPHIGQIRAGAPVSSLMLEGPKS